ncbi:hypothetical protein Tco_1237435 [Tanacetum coccineum]
MAAYQRMTAETDPIQREEALTVYGMETGQSSMPIPETALTVCMTRLRVQLHTILKDIDRYPNTCLEELEAFLTLCDVKPELRKISLETLSVDERLPQHRNKIIPLMPTHLSDFQGYVRTGSNLSLEMSQENGKRTDCGIKGERQQDLTRLQSTLPQELILKLPWKWNPTPTGAMKMRLKGLDVPIVKSLGENSGDKQKWKQNQLQTTTTPQHPSGRGRHKGPTTADHPPRLVKPKRTCKPRRYRNDVLVTDVVKGDITKQVSDDNGSKHQPTLKEDAEHLAEYTAYVPKLR